ncbi:hypothetical protein PG996_001564 [Apiospora saccharicola]|uniref:Uncharacterized protein n=1 Tax=Apiospora saccharicola TaxID=335842 RepID=A0ABR1WGZ2_9PEZI
MATAGGALTLSLPLATSGPNPPLVITSLGTGRLKLRVAASVPESRAAGAIVGARVREESRLIFPAAEMAVVGSLLPENWGGTLGNAFAVDCTQSAVGESGRARTSTDVAVVVLDRDATKWRRSSSPSRTADDIYCHSDCALFAAKDPKHCQKASVQRERASRQVSQPAVGASSCTSPSMSSTEQQQQEHRASKPCGLRIWHVVGEGVTSLGRLGLGFSFRRMMDRRA